MKRQASAWVDFHHASDGTVTVGIECDDPALTFDGHYMCLFPSAPGEVDGEGALKRAEAVLKYMRGERQIKRAT